MSYPINYPTPQGANVQIFSLGPAFAQTTGNQSTWVKPQGASFVWFTLIGGGGRGAAGGGNGGGSGAVTNFMCPAFLIPDELRVVIGKGDDATAAAFATTVIYQQKDGTGYTLLTANSGSSSTAGAATAANAFSAMGFYQSIAGQAGASGAQSASTTTFLSGGAGNAQAVTANYGYTTASVGYFQIQPIIVGVGGGGNRQGGIGCGGSDGLVLGGPGMVVIITW